MLSGSEKNCAIIYDYKLAAQSSSSPHLRIASMRGNGDHLKRMIRCALAANDNTAIGPKDMYFLYDGKKEGNKAALHAGFTGPGGERMTYVSKAIYMTFTEESVAERLEKVRGMMAIDQVERLYIVANDAWENLAEVKRAHYKGSNRGNTLGDIELPSWEDDRATWILGQALKKQVLVSKRKQNHKNASQTPSDEPAART